MEWNSRYNTDHGTRRSHQLTVTVIVNSSVVVVVVVVVVGVKEKKETRLSYEIKIAYFWLFLAFNLFNFSLFLALSSLD